MTWPGRELAEAERPQLAAQRLLTDRQAELVEHPLDQIDQPPAHHSVRRRDRTGLDDPRQGLSLRTGEQRRLARRLAVDETGRSVRVEGENPIAHRLQP